MAQALRTLGDRTRLRILRLLLEESLNVGELTRLLGLAQSTVSKHLAELRRVGLVEGNRSSGFNYYRIGPEPDPWWEAVARTLRDEPDEKGDLTRLRELLRQREERLEVDRFVVPGRSWVAWSRGLGFLLPRLKVADLGCGDGTFTVEMADWAETVYAVDRNPALLEAARRKTKGKDNVRFLNEEMESLSLPDASLDLAVLSHSLHYVEDPMRVLRETERILRPEGRILVFDLLPHREEWVREELGHLWLGFEPARLKDWVRRAGFRKIQLEKVSRDGTETFRTTILTARRPAGTGRTDPPPEKTKESNS